MKPEAQNVAIAEARGYSAAPNEGSIGGFIGRHPNGQHDYYTIGHNWADAIRRICPDYLNDFNAMHEAEKTLTDDQLIDYAEWLGVCFDENPSKACVVLLRATVAQRAEAFLRTIGKW